MYIKGGNEKSCSSITVAEATICKMFMETTIGTNETVSE
jgi:hypothetical protein